jgi:hypothetical protein
VAAGSDCRPFAHLQASSFLFKMVDRKIGLAKVPGSLMIDVFYRRYFATDTNAMLVGFFREFAEAEEAVGNSTGESASLSDSVMMSL